MPLSGDVRCSKGSVDATQKARNLSSRALGVCKGEAELGSVLIPIWQQG